MLDDVNYLKSKDPLFKLLKDLEAVLEAGPDKPEQSLAKSRNFKNLIVVSQSIWQRLAFEVWQASQPWNLPAHHQGDLSRPDWADRHSLMIGFAGSKQLKSFLAEQDSESLSYLLFVDGRQPDADEPLSFYPALRNWHEAATQLKITDKIDNWSTLVAGLETSLGSWQASSPTKSNSAKRLAYEIVGKTPLILSRPADRELARKWKLNFNIYNRQLAWSGVWSPEQTVELQAWQNQILDKNYYPVYLSNSFDQSRQLFLKGAKKLSGKMPPAHLIESPADLPLTQQSIWLALLADFTAAYLAYLNR